MGQQHGGPPASDVKMTDGTREEGGMDPTEAEGTAIKYRSNEGGNFSINQA